MSKWFNGKYIVNPETSKLLQEAVFADGGGWNFNGRNKLQHLGKEYLYINKDGEIYYGDGYCDFQSDYREEKEPPQPKKEFKVGYWYKCVGYCGARLEQGKYYQLFKQQGGLLFNQDMCSYHSPVKFDINSESPCDPTATKALQEPESEITWPTEIAWISRQVADLVKINQQEEVNMSTQRKVVEVQLFDDAKGLPVQDSLVAKFENVLTEDDNDTTIREVIMNNDIKKVLAAHNVKRSKVINQDILERTGNSVPLQPILLKDLRWKVIG